MKKYKFELETVLKVRNYREKAQQQKYAQALQKQTSLENHKQSLIDELSSYAHWSNSQNGAIDALHFQYIEQKHQQIRKMDERIVRAKSETEAERKKLLEARRNTKAMENLEHQHRMAYLKEMDREEQKVMNEIATIRYNRNDR